MSSSEHLHPTETIRNNRVLLLTGISGTGKDFLLQRLKLSDERVGNSITVVNFGELLFEQIRTRGISKKRGIRSRDDMQTLLTNDEVRELISQGITVVLQHEPVILNTHVVYKQNGMLEFNPDVYKRLLAASYVFIWSEPNLILQRREESGRIRDQESLEEIALHQDMAMIATRIVARTLRTGFHFIHNGLDNVDENVTELRKLIDVIC